MVISKDRNNKSTTVKENTQLKSSSYDQSSTASTASTALATSAISTASVTSVNTSATSISKLPSSEIGLTVAKFESNNTENNVATNHSKNAPLALSPSKLIPIQSVLNTDAHHHYHQQAHHQQHSSNQSLQSTSFAHAGHANSSATTFTQFLAPSSNLQPTELPQEDEERLEKLFKSLDRDGNGRIDIHDLSEALREFGLSSVYAEEEKDENVL